MKNRETNTAYVAGQKGNNNSFIYKATTVFATILIGAVAFNGASAQTTRTKVSAIDMITGQNKVIITSAPTTTIKLTQSAVVNTPANYIHGEDKYQKTKEAGHKYREFEVYDINGQDKDKVMLGLLTNTLDRAKRYNDKGAVPAKVMVATTTIDKIDVNGKVVSGQKVSISAIRFNDKILVIIGENDYRYLDGKKLVGDTKVIDALAKGKPITQMTFFYELQHAGYAKNMTAKQFGDLSLSQKERLLNTSNVAGL